MRWGGEAADAAPPTREHPGYQIVIASGPENIRVGAGPMPSRVENEEHDVALPRDAFNFAPGTNRRYALGERYHARSPFCGGSFSMSGAGFGML
jgi:hypothetical protein